MILALGCLVIDVPGRWFHLLLSTVMDSYPEVTQLWDLSHNSDLNQLQDNDFLALLQKQFPTANDGGLFMAPYSNAIDPQNLSSYPLPSLTPPSEDSSPSPPNSNQDNANDDNNDSALKRKASDDDLSDGPTQKSQHTSGELLDLEMKIQSKNSLSFVPSLR
jgi:AP-1-like factor